MKKLLKWLGIFLIGLVAIGLLAVVGVYIVSGSRLNKTYDVAVQPITVPTDAAAIEEGARLTKSAAVTIAMRPTSAGSCLLMIPCWVHSIPPT